MENPIEIDDLGVETPIYNWFYKAHLVATY